MLTDTQLDQLLNDGFIILDDVLDPDAFNQLQTEAQQHVGYRDAKITHGLAQRIRSDRIAWIEAADVIGKHTGMPQGQAFLGRLDGLVSQFNRSLFAGIRRVEAHYACYGEGNFYARHVDNPKGQDSRVFSCVFYLNTDWTDSDGGELVIYTGVNQHTLLPSANRMVIFDSNIAHEVKPAKRTRYSIAAWLRKDD